MGMGGWRRVGGWLVGLGWVGLGWVVVVFAVVVVVVVRGGEQPLCPGISYYPRADIVTL